MLSVMKSTDLLEEDRIRQIPPACSSVRSCASVINYNSIKFSSCLIHIRIMVDPELVDQEQMGGRWEYTLDGTPVQCGVML